MQHLALRCLRLPATMMRWQPNAWKQTISTRFSFPLVLLALRQHKALLTDTLCVLCRRLRSVLCDSKIPSADKQFTHDYGSLSSPLSRGSLQSRITMELKMNHSTSLSNCRLIPRHTSAYALSGQRLASCRNGWQRLLVSDHRYHDTPSIFPSLRTCSRQNLVDTFHYAFNVPNLKLEDAKEATCPMSLTLRLGRASCKY